MTIFIRGEVQSPQTIFRYRKSYPQQ